MKHQPSLKNIREGKAFYVVAVCFVVDVSKEKVLLLRRARSQMIHGGLWAPIGGKLEWDDFKEADITRKNGDVEDWEHIIEALIRREAKEEANIEVNDFHYLDSVGYIRPDGIPSICLKFAGRYLGGVVRFPNDFEASGWFGEREVKDKEAVLGIPEELERAINVFKSKNISLSTTE